ncbi:MAG: hypothetical protein ACM3X9_02665 [Bacillota bacterium]
MVEDSKVAVLLEDLRAQFRTFGEELQLLNGKVDKMDQRIERVEQKLDSHIDQNRQEHQQLMQITGKITCNEFEGDKIYGFFRIRN